jgi:hypothetical protein
MTPPAWLQWLNTAPIDDIERAVRAELGPNADASKLRKRIVGRIRFDRPFESYADLVTAKNIGRISAAVIQQMLARRGFVQDVPPCKHCCPLHCEPRPT